jgi:hypothetical protein
MATCSPDSDGFLAMRRANRPTGHSAAGQSWDCGRNAIAAVKREFGVNTVPYSGRRGICRSEFPYRLKSHLASTQNLGHPVNDLSTWKRLQLPVNLRMTWI